MAEINQETKIFISWHNSTVNNSKEVAHEFEEFFKALFELDVEVFCSADMEPGKWRVSLDKAFYNCSYAVFILQGDAVNANWVNAEYGAFVMKSLLCKDDACTRLIAFKFPDDKKTVSESKAPIKDLQTYELSLTPEQAVLIYFGRLLYELKNGIAAEALSNDDYIALLNEEKGDVFDRYWKIFAKNVALFKQYGKGYYNQREEYIRGGASQEAVADVVANSFELPNLFFDCGNDYVSRESIVDDIKKRLDNYQFVNLVGMGGCGKTTITYNFYNKYEDDYSLVTGKVINGDFYIEFDEEFAAKLNIRYVFAQDGSLDYKATFCKIVEKLMEYKRIEARKYNLFILDVNEDSKYEQISEAIIELKKLKDWRFLVASREKIEALKKTQIDLCKIAQTEKDVVFLKQVFDHYSQERKDFYNNHFTDDNFKDLFKKFGYLPLLVAQLAYYLDEVQKPPTFAELMDWLGDDVVHSDMAVEEAKGIDKYTIVGNFLSKLMDFGKRLDPAQKEIAKYLMMWPAEYYTPDFIQTISGCNFGCDFDKQLNRLFDKCILDRKTDTDGCYIYKMHSLIASSFRDQVFTKKANKEYRDFTTYLEHLNGLALSELDEASLNCIKYSLSHFASFDVKYLLDKASELFDIHFKRNIDKIKTADDYVNIIYKSGTSPICDNALKIKIISLENQYVSLEEIYKRIVGEIKEDGTKVSPMPQADVYYESSFNAKTFLPDEHTDQYGRYISIPVNGITIKMRKVFGGTYQMGDKQNSDNKPHKVTVDDYYIGETQVTQALWDAVMKESGFDNPSRFNDNSLNPVEKVSWYDCYAFIFELYKATGLKFRLPFEAEWEYAARSGGKEHKYSWTDQAERESKDTNFFGKNKEEKLLKQYAWYADNSKQTHCVGDTLPNDLGIYDMSGNVWEWCQDRYGDYPDGSVTDPQGPSSGSGRVLRGGSWLINAPYCRVSNRYWDYPDDRFNCYGFRLSLSSQQKKE